MLSINLIRLSCLASKTLHYSSEAGSGRQHAGVANITESPAQATPVHKASIPNSWDIAAALASGPHQTGENTSCSLSDHAASLRHSLTLLRVSRACSTCTIALVGLVGRECLLKL